MRAKPLVGISVLVADDHVDGAELIEMLLEGNGANVRVVHDGAAALALAETFTPDVLLLDITLPDMNGYELLRKLRSHRALANVVAVAVTGHASERDRAKAIEAGFAVHASKPIDPEALIHLVARLVAPPSAAAQMPTVNELDGVLNRDGLVELLRVLNARTPYRYTALYRYDGPHLRSIALVDRLDPTTTKGADVAIETSFCSLVHRDRASFSTADASKDPRVAGLPLRPDVSAYCGALVRNVDGTPFGSLCHFDHVPRPVPEAEIMLLEQLAPSLARAVATDVF